ncbi:MAG: hypothetical protein UY05_C0058G0007 [Candidatus Peregrinibacteria bacterium GW2011_GWA2_47_7]|nr:MAG: hypothetical protein UY05_C0058G0007 [Candidatus Peregrinibacteria bacterium GW2011_GWA2_47_7]
MGQSAHAWTHAPVVQRIEQRRPKAKMEVQFLPGAPDI